VKWLLTEAYLPQVYVLAETIESAKLREAALQSQLMISAIAAAFDKKAASDLARLQDKMTHGEKDRT
jgi:hypothetical protein